MSNKSHKIFQSFSEAFSKALEIRDISNRRFAEMIGKDEAQVSHWANDRHTPYKRTQSKICEVLQMEIVEMEKGQWIIKEYDREKESSDEYAKGSSEPYSISDEVDSIAQEPTLDDLPRLVRLRDMIDASIQKLINRRNPPADD